MWIELNLIYNKMLVEYLMVFEKFYSVTFSWTIEILKMFIYPEKFQSFYKKKCDRLSLHCPGDIMTLFVKHFKLNLHGGGKISSKPIMLQFVAMP
jgi:hypothetical protein